MDKIFVVVCPRNIYLRDKVSKSNVVFTNPTVASKIKKNLKGSEVVIIKLYGLPNEDMDYYIDRRYSPKELGEIIDSIIESER